ncbi:MAG: carboxypeptidase-like regulatory domain-containing protein, partial [Acidobacteriota bacterium]|nr:carboxypeptidase-like regulatory domain-containing protein [Acidobacteriota bacterium]
MRFESHIRRAVPAILLTLAMAVYAFGQISASLSGTVNDAQGSAVAGAKVTVSDPTRNLQIDAKTSSDGTFSFPVLQPGEYTVTVEAQGFKKAVQSGIVINAADRQSTGTIKLEVGDIS